VSDLKLFQGGDDPIPKKTTSSDGSKKLVKRLKPKAEGSQSSKASPQSQQTPSASPVKSQSTENPSDRPKPQFFLVLSASGRNPRCEAYSTIKEVGQAIADACRVTPATDLRAFLFFGRQLLIPKVKEYAIDLTVTGPDGKAYKVFDSAENIDDLSGLKTGEIVEISVDAVNDINTSDDSFDGGFVFDVTN
jgi:hypothetical protein